MKKTVKTYLFVLAFTISLLTFLLHMQWFAVITGFAIFSVFAEILVSFAVHSRIERIKSGVNVTEEDKKYLEEILRIILDKNTEIFSIINSVVRAVIGVILISTYGMVFTCILYFIMLVLARLRYQSLRNLFLNA